MIPLIFGGCVVRESVNLEMGITAFSQGDEEKAIEIFDKIATDTAYMKLASLYRNRCNGIEDLEEAFKWYLKSAELGNAEAQCIVGHNYPTDITSEPYAERLKKAEFWLTKAAEQGIVEAQNELGEHYLTGNLWPKNYEKAYYWTKMAANNGIVQAQHNLGVCYINGYGISKDNLEAAKWFIQAAEQGCESSVIALESMILYTGINNKTLFDKAYSIATDYSINPSKYKKHKTSGIDKYSITNKIN